MEAPPQVHRPTKVNHAELQRLLNHYPIPQQKDGSPFTYDYGTAGFRYHHHLLPPIMVRMAILSVLRSLHLQGQHVGIMITASHNPEEDNGIKIADNDGGMLCPTWEKMATKIANSNTSSLIKMISSNSLLSQSTVSVGGGCGVVHIGHDTRFHSQPLSELLIRSILAMGVAVVVDHGQITTPQLHWFVMRSNPHLLSSSIMCSGVGSSGSIEREYLEGMVGAYVSLLQTNTTTNTLHSVLPQSNNHNNINDTIMTKSRILVDCACGVGGTKIPILNSIMKRSEEEGRGISLPLFDAVNLPADGPLNDRCGAEYVQKQQRLPKIYTEDTTTANSGGGGGDVRYDSRSCEYVASLDGDADRIVFHYKGEDGRLNLLDGDKIAALVACFIQEEFNCLAEEAPEAKGMSCGVVQTAYANGSSTSYLKNEVKTTVIIAKTGVKFVHAAAHSFDVGIYFEANGHGTVLFGPKFYDFMAQCEGIMIAKKSNSRQNIAWQRLRILPRLINQAVGDALSDLFLVDAILRLKGWSIQKWNSLYKDLPSRQYKIKVNDRSIVQTNDNETRSIAPTDLQPALDAVMASLPREVSPRTFVRPSGTENVVRIYAEASTQVDADTLASQAAWIVYEKCGGVGDKPKLVGGSAKSKL